MSVSFFFLIATWVGGNLFRCKSSKKNTPKKTFHREDTVHQTVGQCAIFFCICKTIGVGRVTFWEQYTKDILLQVPEEGDKFLGH